VVPGTLAPDFTLNDLEGKALALSTLRGKYVVLDFWGNWCHWCIKGFPAMKQAYAKHKAKLEILGIACKATDTNWREAVKKQQLPWLQVHNTGEGVDVVSRYPVPGFPTKILIDPEGQVVKIVIGEDSRADAYYDCHGEGIKNGGHKKVTESHAVCFLDRYFFYICALQLVLF
jgi:thiol-disulfide isomerase/thioredoxin